MTMRIVIVTESFLPRVDGVSRSVSALTRHCREHGHEALVVAPGHGPSEVDGFPVVRVMGVRGFYPGLVLAPVAPGMRRLLDRFAPEVVHLASPAVLGAAALRAARRGRRVPVAAHFQTDVAAYARHYGGGIVAPGVWHWMRRLHNRCDATYAPTETIAAELRMRGVRRVAVSGRGVDTALFRPDRPGRVAARSRWPLTGGPRVLCVSRLAPEKGLGRLVDLARSRPGLNLLLVGTGPVEPELRRAAPPNVGLTGLLEGDELADVYAGADLFAYPSATETFGQVVQEAMASGLPVVGLRAGGVRELVDDGVTGMLADPRGTGFERAVVGLCDHAARRAAMGAAGVAAVSGRTWEAVLGALLDDYARLVPARARPPLPRPHPASGRAAGFLDVDRTVIRGSSSLAMVAPLARAGLLRRRTMVRAALHQLRFAAVGGGEARLARAAARGALVLAGQEAARLREVGRGAVPTRLAPRVFPAARELVVRHHRAGEPVFLVSSAPEEIVAAVAGLLGADGYAASRAEVVDGRYTGRLLRFCQGHEKVRAINELAARHRLDLRRSTAYGDSISDAPMLAAVGTGVCVNPDRRLRGLARLRGWEVRRFRLRPRELGHPERLAAASVTLA